jgi:signal transduction histidine kinase
MSRLGLVWRLALIVVAAFVVIQMVAVAAFYVQRDQLTEAGYQPPLPDQVVALVALLNRAPDDQRALMLRAVNGIGLTTRIAPDASAGAEGGRHLAAVEARIAARLTPPGRFVSVRIIGEPESGDRPFRPFRRLIGNGVRIVVGLASGDYLVVQTAGALMVRLFGIPAGFLASIVGFLVAVLAILGVARETRPLRRLADNVERFGEALEVEPIRERGAPEVRAVIRAVNQMQGRIVRLVQNQSLVVGAISHDLRTYLTRLRLRVEAMPDGDRRAGAVRDIADMQALIEDALAFARGAFAEAKREPVELAALIARECDERRTAGASVHLDLPGGATVVTGSGAALARAFGNLIDNAIKFGEIAQVALTATRGQAIVTIDDRGPGIPPAERRSVFEPFRRLDDSRNREIGGAGLGLAIARQVIESHGGTIEIDDVPATAKGPPRGARFIVRLPLAA